MVGYVIALIGLPGAGKSTVAGFLLGHLPLIEVNRDAIRAAMFPNCRYTSAENQAANAAVYSAIDVHCAAEQNSLVDGMTFADAAERDRLRAQCDRHGYRLLPLWLDCPVGVARRRVGENHAAATHSAADRVPDLVDAVAARFAFPIGDVIRLDATQPVSMVCEQAYVSIQNQLEP